MATNDAGVSVADRALHTTRERILGGTYPPGSRLRLHGIAEETGVSLIPARLTIPNKGAPVSELSIQDMRALYAVRITLESEAVRTPPGRFRPTMPKLCFRSSTTSKSHSTPATDPRHAPAPSVPFCSMSAGESGWLPYWADILWKHAERHRRASLPFRLDGTNSEPREVMAALEKGHNEEAARTLHRHLETTAWQSRSPLAPFQKVGWPTPKSSQRKCGCVGDH